MSSSRNSGGSRWTKEGEISELILKLQALLPEKNRRHLRRISAAPEVLKEVCSYIRKLHKEVDGLSERLSELLASMDHNSTIDPDILRTILQR